MVVVVNTKLADWSPFNPPQMSYQYNDPTLTYNSPGVGFNYLNPEQNQENTKQPADWEPTA